MKTKVRNTIGKIIFLIIASFISTFVNSQSLDITQIINPYQDASCGNSNDSVYVTVTNTTGGAVDTIPLVAVINSTLILRDTLFQSLATGNSIDTVIGYFNMSAGGQYIIQVYTAHATETNGPALVDTFNIQTTAHSVPYNETFDDTEIPPFYFIGDPSNYSYPGGYIQCTLSNESDSVISAKIHIPSTGFYLGYQVSDETAFAADDTVFVRISTDCNTYNTIDTIYSGKDGDFDNGYFRNINSYSGQDITIWFVISTENALFNFVIDEITIRRPTDVGVIEALTKYTCKGDLNDEIQVAIQNFGITSASNIPVEVQVYNPITGITEIFQNTYTDALTPPSYIGAGNGEIDTFTVVNYNTFPLSDESYTVKGYTIITNDADDSNDDGPTFATSFLTPDSLQLIYTFNSDAESWTINNGSHSAGALRTTNINAPGTAYFQSPLLDNITTDTRFIFYYLVESSGTSNTLGFSDTIRVQVSTNCGEDWDDIEVISSTEHVNSDDFAPYAVSLADYAGQRINLRIWVEKDDAPPTWIRLSVDKVKLIDVEDYDFGVINIDTSLTRCGVTNDYIDVEFVCFSYESPSTIEVELTVTRPDLNELKYVKYVTGPIDYLDTIEVTFNGINTLAYGVYTFDAKTVINIDNDNSNDELPGIQKEYFEPDDELDEDFSAALSDEWTLDEMAINGSERLESSALAVDDAAYAITPEIGPIGENDYLTFDYLLSTDGVPGDDDLGRGDKVYIQISLDCGLSYTTLITIDSITHEAGTGYTTDTFDLASYEGELVYFRFYAVKQDLPSSTTTFSVEFDNIAVTEIWDVSVEDVILESGSCWQPDELIQVVVKNNTPRTISNIPLQLEVKLENSEVYSDTTYYLDDVISSLDYTEENTVNFVISTRSDGDYTFTAYTQLEDDSFNDNDTLANGKSILPVYPLPYLKTGQFDSTDLEKTNFTAEPDTLISNQLSDEETATVATNMFGPLPANQYLIFDYNIESDAGNGYQIGRGDTIFIQISTNCKQTYQTIDMIYDDIHIPTDELIPYAVDLSSYNNDEIAIRIVAVKYDVVGSISSYYTMKIDNIEISSGIDGGVTDIILSDLRCGITTDNAEVVITNFSAAPLSDIPVELSILRPNGTTIVKYGTYSGTINMGESASLIINNINTTLAGDYEFDAITVIDGDNNTANDQYSDNEGDTRNNTIYPVIPLSSVEPFDGDFEDDYWDLSDFNHVANDILKSNPVMDGDTLLLETPLYGPLTSQSQLVFDFLVESNTLLNEGSNSLGAGDVINIYISTDCAESWINIGSIHEGNSSGSADFEAKTIDLGAYSGNNVFFLLELVKNNIQGYSTLIYQLSIDNFKVLNGSDYDYGVSEIIESTSLCGEVDDYIEVVVTNFGTDIYSGSIQVDLEITDPYDEEIIKSQTTSGNIASGSSTTLTFNVNTSILDANGYSFKAYTSLAEDNLSENDTSEYAETFYFSQSAFVEDFNGGLTNPNEWDDENFNFVGDIGKTDVIVDDSIAILRTPRLGPLAENSYLLLDYYVETDLGNEIGPGDTIFVQVSDDCGLTWQTTDSLHATNQYISSDTLTGRINLLDFAGEEVYVKFIILKSADLSSTTEYIIVSIDNMYIDTLYDVQAAQVIVPELTCGSESDVVGVSVFNNTPIAISDIPVELAVELDEEYITSYFEYITIESYTLDTVLFTINTSEYGTYTLTAITLLDGDSNNDNDTATIDQAYNEPVELAYAKSSDFDDGSWIGDNLAGNTDSLITNNLSVGDDAYILSPRIVIPSDGAYFYYQYKTISNLGNILGKGDTIKIQVSDDCSATYETVFEYNSSTKIDEEFVTDSIDLSSYAGQIVAVRFLAEKDAVVGSATTYFSFEIDNIFVNNGKDVGVTDIILSDNECGFESNIIEVEVENFGQISVNEIPVRLVVTMFPGEPDEYEYEIADTINTSLAGGDKDTIGFSIDVDEVGTYEFEAFTEIPEDIDNSNDTLSGISNTVVPLYPVPTMETFDGITPIEDWLYTNFTNNDEAISGTLSAGQKAILRTKKLGPIPSDYIALSFLYHIQSNMDNLLDNGDSVHVMISNDCGNNYTTIYEINSSTHTLDIDSYFLVTLDISSYIGDDIFVKFVAKNVQLTGDKRSNFQVRIDELSVNNGADVGITAILRNGDFPACGLEDDPIGVIIENFGVLPQTNIPVKIDVFGTHDTTIFATYSGILYPYESDILIVGNINTSKIGVYEIAAQTTLAADSIVNNNKTELTIEIEEPEELPYSHDFDDNTGWIFDYANTAGIFAPQANLEPGDSAVAVSPKIGPIEDNYYLAFDAWFRSISNIATSDENFFRSGDEVEIQVSEDCGFTFTTLYIINSANAAETTGREPYGGISLDSYIGSELIFRIIGRRAASATDDYSMYFEIDDFEVITPDFGVTAFENPVSDICGSALDTIEIVVENLGVIALGNIPVTVEVTGDEFADVIFNTTIPEVMLPGDDTTLYIGTVNTLYPQDYYFSAYTSVIDDDNSSNDESTLTITIPEVKEVPYVQDFDDWVNNFWTGWSFEATNAGWYLINNGDWDLASDILEEDDTATITTTKYGPINNNYVLFDYLIEAYDANDDFVGNYLRRNDTIKVMISNDCGDTYTVIHEINNLNHVISDEFQTAFVDLSAYNGQEIVVKFEIVKGIVGSMEFFFDNFEIQQGDTARVVDVDVISFNEACGRADDVAMVVVRNFGYNTLTDVPVVLEVIAQNTDDISISSTVPGPIGPGERDTAYISPINTQVPGEYKFRAYTTYSENILLNADSITYEVRGLEQLPYTDNFAGALGFVESEITNGNLWSSDGSYARTGKLYNGDSAIAISPKIGPVSAQSILEFDYMIDAYDLSGSMVGNYLRANDNIQILISVDCGETWEVLYTINSGNHIESDEDATLYIDLAAYAGQNAIFKFIAIKGTIGTYELKIDYYHISIPDPVINITQLFDTQEGLCGNSLDSISVEISNSGNTIFTEVQVQAIVTRTDLNGNVINVASFNNNYSVNLNPGELDTLYIGAFSTLSTGSYTVDVIVTAEGDDDDATYVPIFIQGLTTIPYTEVFYYNWLPTGWLQDSWNNYVYINGTDRYMIITNTLSAGESATLQSPKLGPVTANSHLAFEYRIYSGSMTVDDTVKILISNDCGITYQVLETIFNDENIISDNTTWVTKVISLASYVGEDVIIKFEATKGNIGNYRFAIDNFYITKPNIQITNILTRNEVICGLDNDSVQIVVVNNGMIDQSIIPVEVSITAQDWNAVTIDEVDYALTGQLNDTLEPGETDTINVGPFNSEIPGNYSIEAILQVTDNSINTSFIGALSIQQAQSVPYSEDFESLGVIPGFWYTYNVSFINAVNNYISINNIYQGDEAYIITPKITGITENSFLYYDYMLLNGGMEVEDTIWVLVSADCGTSYTIIDTLIGLGDEFGYNVFNTNLISLAAFSGEDIVVKFQTVKQSNGTYSVAFDNIKLENGNDVGITNIYSQNNAGDRFVTCGTALDSIYITIQNFGKNSQSNIPVVVVKTLQNGTDSTENYTFIPTLDQGETGELLIGTVNTVNPGFVEIIAYTDVADDYEIENDTLGFVITTQRPYNVPYIALKGNYFNEVAYWDLQNIATNQIFALDLTTLAPVWYAGAPTQNYLQNGDTAYAVTPKIRMITENSYLVFNYNAYNSIYGHIIYEESIEVQVSNDCGTTYETIQRIDVTNNDTTANAVNYISIGDYAGDEIIIRFEIVKGKSVGFFRVDLDEIVVVDYIPVDLPDDTIIYPFTTITLDAGPNYDSYNWLSLATGNTVLTWSQVYTVTQEGTYIVTVTKNGIISSDTIIITSVVPIPDKPTTQSEIICNRRSSWHTTRAMLNVTMYYWTITPAEAGIVNGNDAIVEITWSEDYFGEVTLSVQAVYANGIISEPSEELDLILDACLGIDDIEKNGLITNIYPVPSTGKVFININGKVNEEFEMRIFDIHGKLMNYELFNYVPVKEIDMAGYNKGVYIIELRSDNDVFYGKAIIE